MAARNGSLDLEPAASPELAAAYREITRLHQQLKTETEGRQQALARNRRLAIEVARLRVQLAQESLF
ncbi:hypothetical protein [Thiomonas sp.]